MKWEKKIFQTWYLVEITDVFCFLLARKKRLGLLIRDWVLNLRHEKKDETFGFVCLSIE